MDKYGFVRVAAAVPVVAVGDGQTNAERIEELILQARQKQASVVVFPQLSLTGSTCGDLFTNRTLLDSAQQALAYLLKRTEKQNVLWVVGMPVQTQQGVWNAAVLCSHGKILGVVPQTYLTPSQMRWFTSPASSGEVCLCGQTVPVGTDLIVEVAGAKIGVEIGGDLLATVPVCCSAALQGADIICNLAGAPTFIGRAEGIRQAVEQLSARAKCGYVYVCGGWGESTTDGVYDASAFIYENGQALAASQRFLNKPQLITTEIDVEKLRSERSACLSFRTDSAWALQDPYRLIPSGVVASQKPLVLTRPVVATPFVAPEDKAASTYQEVFDIQVAGLATRLQASHTSKVVLGISGGLDSTLALLVCVGAMEKLGLPRKNIIGVTMPGFGTTGRTYQNAVSLIKNLKITYREVDIKQACLQHFNDIGHDLHTPDATYENAQARERTQVLMDLANQYAGLVVGTGDLSELALGWATYNGDHMSMYGVNAGVAKTQIRAVVSWIRTQSTPALGRILTDILHTPISPELLPAKHGQLKQKTEELVGPYELHDFFLYYFLRYGFSPAKIFYLAGYAFKGKFPQPVIKKWLRVFFQRFFTQQFKRSCSPDGPGVNRVGLSPRGGWEMPSDASAKAWLKEIEKL